MDDEPSPSPDGSTAGPRVRWPAHVRAWRSTHSRGVHVAITVLCCYLTGLVVANFGGAIWLGHNSISLFPHLGPSTAIDPQSVNIAWSTIEREYFVRDVPGSVGTDGGERGIVEALKQKYNDRFTTLFTPSQSVQFHSDLAGQRTGSIGIAIEARCPGETLCAQSKNPTEVVIESVLRNQPADRAGLKNGDVLVGVDGTTLAALGASPSDQITALTTQNLIRGAAGTSVTLRVQRKGQPLTITVTRADLSIPTVYSQRLGRVLYLQVTGFSTDTGDVAKQQLQQGASGASAVILDLRRDGGGYVTAAQTLASQFLEPGPQVQDVVVRRGRMANPGDPNSAQQVQHDVVQPGGVATKPKLVVLVDGDTASASEIVTAALRDYGRATVVGDKTFGKGSVQVDFPLPDGDVLHLTVEKWFGPKGETIDGQGITPDVSVALPNPDSRFGLDTQSVDPSQDPQMQQALKIAGG